MSTGLTFSTEVEVTRRIWRAGQFSYGPADCLISVADHIHRVAGVDPAMLFRGLYQSEAEAEKIMGTFGGLLGLARFAMASVGLAKGDRGPGRPVVADVRGVHVAGIDLGGMVMLRTQRGLIDLRTPVVSAWVI